MKARYRVVLSVVGLMLAARGASAAAIDSLALAERLRLDAGGMVVHTQNFPASSWPAVTVYQHRVVWGKVSTGGHSDAIFGRAVFEPRDGKTVFSYFNYTRITMLGGGIFADESVTRTQAMVRALARRMEQESSSGGAEFQADLARLRAVLGG